MTTPVAISYRLTPTQESINSLVNLDFDDIVNYINVRNAGTTAWDAVLAITASVTGTLTAGHFKGGTSAPAIAANLTGIGANGTVSIAGTDAAGMITINTNIADTPGANSDLVTVTFNVAYGVAPYVIIGASNDTAAALAYGVVRCRQADTTTLLFKLRSGAVPLTAITTATYTFNYHVIQ